MKDTKTTSVKYVYDPGEITPEELDALRDKGAKISQNPDGSTTVSKRIPNKGSFSPRKP